MGGLTSILFPDRERLSGFISFLIVGLSAVLLAGPPHRTIVDGKPVAEAVVFGYVVPKWPFVITAGLIFGFIWFCVHRLLNWLWPEKMPSSVNSESDKAPPSWTSSFCAGAENWTPLEFLTAERVTPLSAVVMDVDWREEYSSFPKAQKVWIAAASESALAELIPAARSLDLQVYEEVPSRLMEAYQTRGIPTFAELADFAVKVQNEELWEYLCEDFASPQSSD